MIGFGYRIGSTHAVVNRRQQRRVRRPRGCRGRHHRVTYGFALATAETLARGKGETENALTRLPFRGAYMIRPAFIRPTHGERSKTTSYRVIYAATGWLFPVLRELLPRRVTGTGTDDVARAMLRVARERVVSLAIVAWSNRAEVAWLGPRGLPNAEHEELTESTV